MKFFIQYLVSLEMIYLKEKIYWMKYNEKGSILCGFNSKLIGKSKVIEPFFVN